jgi:hypothetical protein
VPGLYVLFMGLGAAVCMVGAVLIAGLRATRRITARGGDRLRLRRQLRRAWLTLIWALVLPLTLLALVLTGYGVLAVWALIGYTFLGVSFMVLAQTVLIPRARRRAGR